MPEARMLRAIVCDDIRQESSGKTILLGVFCGGVIYSGPLGAPPPELELAFYMEALVHGSAPFKVRFEKKGASKPLLEFEGEIVGVDQEVRGFESDIGYTVPVTFEKNRVSFAESGIYCLRGKIAGGKWSELLSFEIKIVRHEP